MRVTFRGFRQHSDKSIGEATHIDSLTHEPHIGLEDSARRTLDIGERLNPSDMAKRIQNASIRGRAEYFVEDRKAGSDNHLSLEGCLQHGDSEALIKRWK